MFYKELNIFATTGRNLKHNDVVKAKEIFLSRMKLVLWIILKLTPHIRHNLHQKTTPSRETRDPVNAKNTVTPPSFLVWKFCGIAQVPQSVGRIARNCAKAVPFPQNLHTRKFGEITLFFSVCQRDVMEIFSENC